jgi:Cu+-exporting ATPase
MDSFAGFIFLLLIGRMLQHKTHRSLAFDRDYKAYFPIAVLLKKGKEWISTSIENLTEGDRIRLRNGEIVPADAEMSSLNGLFDYSFITGEADPVQKYQTQPVLAGGRVHGKSVELTLTKKVDQSFLTRIWNEASGRSNRSERFDQTNLFSAIFTYAILVIALGTAIYWLITDSSMIWMTVTSVLIIACPCAIAIAPSFSFGTASTLMARQGFYIRKPTVLPELAHITDIVFDKTGTLTSEKLVEVSWQGIELKSSQQSAIKMMLEQSTHPLSRAIVSKLDIPSTEMKMEGFKELPGEGLLAKINKIEYKLGSPAFANADLSSAELATKGEESRVYVSWGAEYAGYFSVKQPVRKGLAMLLKSLKANYKLRLLSGDSERFRESFSPLFGDNMLFGQGVDNKVGFVENLRGKGAKVLMVGDGLNDAGALRVADVGIAVSDSTSSFSPGSDVIVASNHLENLDKLLKTAAFSNNVVSASYFFSILYNGIGLWLAVQGWLTPLACAILMPVSSISVILFSTLSVYFYHQFANRES